MLVIYVAIYVIIKGRVIVLMSLNLKDGRYGGGPYTWERESIILPRMEVKGLYVACVLCLHRSWCTSEGFGLSSSPCSTLPDRPAAVAASRPTLMVDRTRYSRRE